MLMHQSRSAPLRVIGLALAIAAASLIADIASAKGDDGRVSTVVNYGDLDLSQSADVRATVCAVEVRVGEGLLQPMTSAVCACRRRQEACYEAAL